jgi:glutamyl-tRNA reductase
MSSDLFVIGLSWRTAPVALREQLAFTDDELPEALEGLVGLPSIDEAMVMSTCNRVEVYGATSQVADASVLTEATAEAMSFLYRSRGIDAESVSASMYEHSQADAVRHVFRVASALDSLVIGEAQILGQLKSAYGFAVTSQTTGPVLGRCLEKAFSVAKRVRNETGVSRGAANVSSVAVELARRVFVELTGKNVLVVGAGKMSALAVRHLRTAGAGTIMVTNRSPEKAERLADEVDGIARPWDQLESLLALADVVITSTGAREPVLTRKLMKRVMKKRRYQSIVIIDIAVPRDADPAAGRLDGVYLFDIDDLQRVVTSNLKERAREAEAAHDLVDGEVTTFESWLRSQRVVPTIRALREHFSRVADAEVERTLKAVEKADTPKKREQAIRRMGALIINKLLHTPMTALKSGGDQPAVEELVSAANRLFELSGRENAERAADSDDDDDDEHSPVSEARENTS